jgi:hypothetical protein
LDLAGRSTAAKGASITPLCEVRQWGAALTGVKMPEKLAALIRARERHSR